MSTSAPGPAKPSSGKVVAMVIALAGVSLLTTLMLAMFALNRARLSAQDSSASPITATHLEGFGMAPVFELIERSGQTVHSRDLQGKIWLASFTFTRCLGVCPVMNARAKQIQDAVLQMPGFEDVMLVSFTVDPENDTPQVLAARAKQLEADVSRWLWLSGPQRKIWAVASQGFKLAVEADPDNTDMPIAHSSKFVIVDRDGRIHGYYDSLDPSAVDMVLNEIRNMIHK